MECPELQTLMIWGVYLHESYLWSIIDRLDLMPEGSLVDERFL